MPVELRKRKAHQEPAAAAPAPKKAASKAKKAAPAKKEAPAAADEPKKEEKATETKKEEAAAAEAKPATKKVAKGDTITLDGFGGEIETNDGKKTTLKALVEESENGVVLFTYPKASTPGCTYIILHASSHASANMLTC